MSVQREMSDHFLVSKLVLFSNLNYSVENKYSTVTFRIENEDVLVKVGETQHT